MAFVLTMITVSLDGSVYAKSIGMFEHYAQCLQAEAAMSEALGADERSHYGRTFYRCFPVGSEQKES